MQVDIKSINTFDATIGTNVLYSWGGNPVYRTRIIIKNSSGTTVMNNISPALNQDANDPIFTTTIPIPANVLTNGQYYDCFIQVSTEPTEAGATVTWSDIQSVGYHFKCVLTPGLTFVVPAEIEVSTYTFNATYTYVAGSGEPIKSWHIDILNSSNVVVATSGVRYEDNQNTTVTLKFTYNGLNGNTEYHAIAYAITTSDLETSVESNRFNQKIPDRNKFYILDPINVECEGAIQVETNIVMIDGHLYEYPGKFMKNSNNEYDYLALRHNGLYYNSGFNFDGDFILSILAADLDSGEEICFLTNSTYNKQTQRYGNMTYRVSINYMEGYFGGQYDVTTGTYTQGEKKGVFELVVVPKTQSMVQEVEHQVDYTDFYGEYTNKQITQIKDENFVFDSSYNKYNITGYDPYNGKLYKTKSVTAVERPITVSKAMVYYSNFVEPAMPEDFYRVNVMRKSYPVNKSRTDVHWEITATYVDSDNAILMSHSQMSAYTHQYLSGYTHKEIRGQKPIDCPEKGG